VRNYHAHLLSTSREVTPTGLGEKASIEWSDTARQQRGLKSARKELTEIRECWASITNEKLLEHGHDSRIDHRSLKAQGIERQPTTHLGPAVAGMERRGIETEVGNRVREEQRQEMQRRLERAAELGRIEREQQALSKSILDLSGDLEAAKRERAKTLPLRYDLEAVRRQAREAWLAARAEPEQGRGLEPPENAREQPSLSLDDDFSL
jgi:hypothetical protein